MLCLAAGDVGRGEVPGARLKFMRVRQWWTLGVRLSGGVERYTEARVERWQWWRAGREGTRCHAWIA